MLKPLHDTVWGRLVVQSPLSQFLILPYEQKEETVMEIIAVGPGVKDPDIRVGSLAILQPRVGALVTLTDIDTKEVEQAYLVPERFVLAVFAQEEQISSLHNARIDGLLDSRIAKNG